MSSRVNAVQAKFQKGKKSRKQKPEAKTDAYTLHEWHAIHFHGSRVATRPLCLHYTRRKPVSTRQTERRKDPGARAAPGAPGKSQCAMSFAAYSGRMTLEPLGTDPSPKTTSVVCQRHCAMDRIRDESCER